MALSLQDSNLVWQKTKISLESLAADPIVSAAFKALKEKLAGVGGNPTLEFIPITATDIDDASGKVLANVACKLYGVFLKKQATATDVYTHIINDATDDTGVTTDTVVVLATLVTGEQAFAIYPSGLSMSAGVVAKAYTTPPGVTDSASADTPNGFVIISAA